MVCPLLSDSLSSESLVKRDGEGREATFTFDADVGGDFFSEGLPSTDFAVVTGKTLVRLKLSSSEEGRPSLNEGIGGGGVDSAGLWVVLFGGRILNCMLTGEGVDIAQRCRVDKPYLGLFGVENGNGIMEKLSTQDEQEKSGTGC